MQSIQRARSALAPRLAAHAGELRLEPGSRVGVVGGGPAGSFFAFFLLDMAARIDLRIEVDVYEPHDYARPGPSSCNHCGGIVSESLVQLLAAEGINLPEDVVQRGIDSYVLHVQGEGSLSIDTPLNEKRIAAVQRGAGPRGLEKVEWRSFDGFLQDLTRRKGVRVISDRVTSIERTGGRPAVRTKGGGPVSYDLLAVAIGVNSALLRFMESLGAGYVPPRTTRTYISEFSLDRETVEHHLGSSMHVFLLDIPGLEFSAIVPKGEHVTLCLLGEAIDDALVQDFLSRPEVRECFPPGWTPPPKPCHCAPSMNVGDAVKPFADRMVFIGDAGVTRLYKDGIGAAYRTAKAAAMTAVFEGISAEDFFRHYAPMCRSISRDNRLGRLVFAATRLVKGVGPARRAVARMVAAEQRDGGPKPRMSSVLWDTFTGSSPYRDILLRALHPIFLGRLAWNGALGLFVRASSSGRGRATKRDTSLGIVYADGETIVVEGEAGDHMFVIQAGKVEVVRGELRLAVLSAGDFFGEMALFSREVRSATVRALGEARVLSVDKKTFMRRIAEDASLAFRVTRRLALRVRDLNIAIGRKEDRLRPRSPGSEELIPRPPASDQPVLTSDSEP